jgi:hypothetical protein
MHTSRSEASPHTWTQSKKLCGTKNTRHIASAYCLELHIHKPAHCSVSLYVRHLSSLRQLLLRHLLPPGGLKRELRYKNVNLILIEKIMIKLTQLQLLRAVPDNAAILFGQVVCSRHPIQSALRPRSIGCETSSLCQLVHDFESLPALLNMRWPRK